MPDPGVDPEERKGGGKHASLPSGTCSLGGKNATNKLILAAEIMQRRKGLSWDGGFQGDSAGFSEK